MIKILLRLFYLESFPKISLALNIFLILALCFSALELHKAALSLNAKNRISIENSIFSKNADLDNSIKAKNDFELESFLAAYLDKIFSLNETNYDTSFQWLKSHSHEDFFDKHLASELEQRYKNGLETSFQLDKIYTENLEDSLIKVICYGKELNKKAEDSVSKEAEILRSLIIELVINTDTRKLEEILNIKEN